MQYNPKDAQTAWDEAEYDAELFKVEETTSKTSGNEMEVWHVKVYNDDGRDQTIKDYVVVPGATFKIKQLAEALGKRPDFDSGRFQAGEHIGSRFRVGLTIEQQEGYDDRNKIGRYKAAGGPAPSQARPFAAQAAAVRNKPKAESPFETAPPSFRDEDIPFRSEGRIQQDI